jgi:deoxyribodipyrimidine photolyase-related protein
MPNAHAQTPIGVWILPDQLIAPAEHPALRAALEAAQGRKDRISVVLVESRRHAKALPYHKKRLAFILACGRHFAEELRRDGWQVDVLSAERFAVGLREHWAIRKWSSLFLMKAAEAPTAELQQKLADRSTAVPFRFLPNAQFRWLETAFSKPNAKNVVMETFYRTMRKHFRLLIEADGSPTGGQWNFDADNRKPLPKDKDFPSIPRFEPDALTSQVMAEVEAEYPESVGSTAGFDMPVTRAQAEEAFADFLASRLADFGPYEDAMSRTSGTLWHSMMSPAMNLGLLDGLAMCRQAEQRYHDGLAPLASVEGFIRQIIGWREYVHWQYVRQMPNLRHANGWNHTRPTPQFWWDGRTDMACMSTVLGRLLATAMNHHIERLMLLCNFAMLAGIAPESVANWFLTWYADSHDWVVLPNVIGMGLNADGGKTATKPYIASAAYVDKMSDFCPACRFDRKKRTGENACPFNTLYWNFLIRHETKLRANPRMGPNVLGLRHLKPDEREAVVRDADAFLKSLVPYDDPILQPDTDAD